MTPSSRERLEAAGKKCSHINCAGHEWESWCLDCGERWANNLHMHIHTTVGTFNIMEPPKETNNGEPTKTNIHSESGGYRRSDRSDDAHLSGVREVVARDEAKETSDAGERVEAVAVVDSGKRVGGGDCADGAVMAPLATSVSAPDAKAWGKQRNIAQYEWEYPDINTFARDYASSSSAALARNAPELRAQDDEELAVRLWKEPARCKTLPCVVNKSMPLIRAANSSIRGQIEELHAASTILIDELRGDKQAAEAKCAELQAKNDHLLRMSAAHDSTVAERDALRDSRDRLQEALRAVVMELEAHDLGGEVWINARAALNPVPDTE